MWCPHNRCCGSRGNSEGGSRARPRLGTFQPARVLQRPGNVASRPPLLDGPMARSPLCGVLASAASLLVACAPDQVSAPSQRAHPVAAVGSNDCTDCWTTKASTHAAHVGVAAVAVGGSLYAIGGGTATVEAYDPATDTWTTKAPLPTMRSYTGAAEVGGIIYVVGGFDSTGNILADLLAYDPTTD